MLEVNRILKVPAEEKTRSYLRKKVKLFQLESPVLPPADLKTLETIAEGLLEKSGLTGEWLDFTIVLLGNEIWGDIVASIPYNRRLLLLPQCLRDKNRCKGVFDELGLICAGCNSCHLNSILEKAEKLGYTTLVAEGTTVAVGLVEEGAIDAVIGVSCMPVLHRSFDPVTRAAIPGIGIPLLENGCENTTVDYKWLLEEIMNYRPDDSLLPVSVSRLKNEIADYFKSPVLTNFFSSGNKTEKLAMEIMSRGGQRIRPLLASIAYQSYAAGPSGEIRTHLAIAIECFHKASLIHDDIEDDEEMRYGHTTLHKEMGVPVAINTGDFLVGKGYLLISQMQIDPMLLSGCFRVVSESHVKLSEGQGEDLMLAGKIGQRSVEDVINIFRLKTGEAIKVSLLAGAVAGDAPKHDLETLENFSYWFGIAYQIRDDLTEFYEEERRTNLFDFPFLLILLKENMDKLKLDFNKIIKENNISMFVSQVEQSGIVEKAEMYYSEYIGRCYSELDNLENRKIRLALYRVLGKVFKDNEFGR
ncbi:MAG: polyprenyl synthetase family protein [Prolixibacteraceae bacterium]|nr:polyprenyl synthetase family protein [Prolixibacteraceae bacterium]